jgi:hypothetical protein
MRPAAPGYSVLTLKDHMQYELLNAADVAFILKHRPGSMPPGQYLNQSTIGGVGMGVDRMQKLCGFEWLQLYSTTSSREMAASCKTPATTRLPTWWAEADR